MWANPGTARESSRDWRGPVRPPKRVPGWHSVEHCRVRLVGAGLLLEFRATLDQGRNFAEAVRCWPAGLRVLVDYEVRPDLPALPCGRLWD
jgi:hypothetical protein